jgi:glyoxylase-like metal-dependent hydrolase (beta-lactamase superfamily II)
MAVAIKLRREFEFEYGRVDQLSPLVRRVVCKNPNPFTFTGTATFLVGRGEVAVIDPGPLLESHLEAVVGALGPDEQITKVLISHTHSDHSPGAAWIKERTGAATFGYGPHGEVRADDPDDKVDFSKYISAEEKARYDKEYEDMDPALKREGPDLDFRPDVTVPDGARIEGEGWTLEAIWTPGHCSNHLCFGLVEEATLFSGDHVMAWATSVVGPPDGSMRDYLASLRKLVPRDEFRQYLPNHGPAVDEPGDYVRSFIAHREDREQQILSYLREGPQQIADVVPTMYAAYDKRLWYPAAASVLAHLIGMVEDGRVALDGGGEPKLTAVYRAA